MAGGGAFLSAGLAMEVRGLVPSATKVDVELGLVEKKNMENSVWLKKKQKTRSG